MKKSNFRWKYQQKTHFLLCEDHWTTKKTNGRKSSIWVESHILIQGVSVQNDKFKIMITVGLSYIGKHVVSMFLNIHHLSFIKKNQKSNIGWPQQPQTEKMLKFNMIVFYDFFFKTSKKSYISAPIIKFKNLDISGVLSSDFPGLRNLYSLIDLRDLCNLTSLNTLNSPISFKNLLILMVWSFLAPKWPILVPFCGINYQKSKFSLKFVTF